MPLLNYTTSIAPQKTVMEIQALLAKAGASAILADYDTEGNIVALSFHLKEWKSQQAVSDAIENGAKPFVPDVAIDDQQRFDGGLVNLIVRLK